MRSSDSWANDPLLKGHTIFTSKDRINRIRVTREVKWLRILVSSRDNSLSVRKAAERRLKQLAKEGK